MSNQPAYPRSMPTVLCVDDEPEVVDSIARHLHKYEIKVKKALNGMQGIWLANTEKADVVITDLKMPLVDGIEMIEVVRHIPVIAVTGIGDKQTKQKLLDAGAAAVLFKPVKVDRLIAEIRKHIPLVLRTSSPAAQRQLQ